MILEGFCLQLAPKCPELAKNMTRHRTPAAERPASRTGGGGAPPKGGIQLNKVRANDYISVGNSVFKKRRISL